MALARYVQGFDDWNCTGNFAAMKSAWMAVGLAQRDLPAHVVHEYCRPARSFHPRPAFNEPVLPRILTFHNFNTNCDESLYPLLITATSGLGVDFGLAVGGGRAVRSGGFLGAWGIGREWASHDLAAVSHLDVVRTADLTQSLEILNSARPAPRMPC